MYIHDKSIWRPKDNENIWTKTSGFYFGYKDDWFSFEQLNILNIFRLTFLCQDWENSHESDFFLNMWPAAWSQKILVFDILNCGCFASFSWHTQSDWLQSFISTLHFRQQLKQLYSFFLKYNKGDNNFLKWPKESKQNSIVQRQHKIVVEILQATLWTYSTSVWLRRTFSTTANTTNSYTVQLWALQFLLL